MTGLAMTGTALAILLNTGAAAQDSACDIVWNAEYRYRLAGSDIVAKTDRFTGYRSREALEAAARASVDGDPRDLDRVMNMVSHGEDCDGDGAMDAYRHIFLDGAPIGFTPEDWADVREFRNDPVYDR